MLVIKLKRGTDRVLLTTSTGEQIWVEVCRSGECSTTLGITAPMTVKVRHHKGEVPTTRQPVIVESET